MLHAGRYRGVYSPRYWPTGSGAALAKSRSSHGTCTRIAGSGWGSPAWLGSGDARTLYTLYTYTSFPMRGFWSRRAGGRRPLRHIYVMYTIKEASETTPLSGGNRPTQLGLVSSQVEVRSQTDDSELVPRAGVTGVGEGTLPPHPEKTTKAEQAFPRVLLMDDISGVGREEPGTGSGSPATPHKGPSSIGGGVTADAGASAVFKAQITAPSKIRGGLYVRSVEVLLGSGDLMELLKLRRGMTAGGQPESSKCPEPISICIADDSSEGEAPVRSAEGENGAALDTMPLLGSAEEAGATATTTEGVHDEGEPSSDVEMTFGGGGRGGAASVPGTGQWLTRGRTLPCLMGVGGLSGGPPACHHWGRFGPRGGRERGLVVFGPYDSPC